jgi:hypothetical protein
MLTLVIASVGGTFALMQILNVDNVSAPHQHQGALLTGNVKVTQFDGDGNIIAYRQSDNHIVLSGMETIMAQLFGNMNSTAKMPNLTSDLVHPVRFMQIGTNGERRLLANDTSIQAPIASCIRQLATFDNATGVDGPAHNQPVGCDNAAIACAAQMNVTATASFLGSASCNVASIDEAGIFNNATSDTTPGDAAGDGGGQMFARNTFGSVTLMMLDTLQLDWEFTFTDS